MGCKQRMGLSKGSGWLVVLGAGRKCVAPVLRSGLQKASVFKQKQLVFVAAQVARRHRVNTGTEGRKAVQRGGRLSM